MPATDEGRNSRKFVLGVDGCPYGWLAVRLYPHEAVSQAPALRLSPSFEALMRSEWGQAALVMVDIPIGLADRGRRGCDKLARKLLGRGRASSVFPAPRRPMLDMASYEEANAWGKAQGKDAGGGLSKQAWNITPKIREVDKFLTPTRQAAIREGHPEVAFCRLNSDQPVATPKRTSDGLALRRDILSRHGITGFARTWQDFSAQQGRKAAAEDDFLDACALALTACAVLRGEPVHHLTEGKIDARGLKMEIWG